MEGGCGAGGGSVGEGGGEEAEGGSGNNGSGRTRSSSEFPDWDEEAAYHE
jgi:hypothetical protein